MARRRNSSFVSDVVDIAARFPWPIGLALAVVFFVGFDALAGMELPARVKPAEAGYLAARQFIKISAAILRWVIPVLFLLGSALSALDGARRNRQYQAVADADSPSALKRMTWRDFERLVGDYFDRRGFKVRELGGGGADGGIDLIALRGSDEYLVQCKQWKALRVGVVPVRELYGVVSARRAAGGFMVTSGSFTHEAMNFAAGTSIELIDGGKLASAISRQNQTAGSSSTTREFDGPTLSAAPHCPKCEAEMVLRTARTGPSAGSQFWGCSRYPGCRGTRPVT